MKNIIFLTCLFIFSCNVKENNLPNVDSAEEEDVTFGRHVPFGPMLAVAGLVYFLGFHLYVDAYFADFVFNFLTP